MASISTPTSRGRRAARPVAPGRDRLWTQLAYNARHPAECGAVQVGGLAGVRDVELDVVNGLEIEGICGHGGTMKRDDGFSPAEVAAPAAVRVVGAGDAAVI